MSATGLRRTAVRVTYLEMRSQPARSAQAPAHTLLLRAEEPSPELGRFLYTAVGGSWYWRDRLEWTWDEWLERLSKPEVETWVLSCRGTPAGYYELEAQPKGNAQIIYFGLLPSFVGRRLGGYLLASAVSRAWEMGPKIERVWVHTCSLDHPAALPNYLARGFTIYAEEEITMSLPEAPPGPWPGAGHPAP